MSKFEKGTKMKQFYRGSRLFLVGVGVALSFGGTSSTGMAQRGLLDEGGDTRVLMIGDSMADDLGRAMAPFINAFLPSISLELRAVAGTGITTFAEQFIRVPERHWHDYMLRLVGTSGRYRYVIIMMGGNDAQGFHPGPFSAYDGPPLRARPQRQTFDYEVVYGHIAARMVRSLLARGIVPIWIGIPASTLGTTDASFQTIDRVLKELASLEPRFIYLSLRDQTTHPDGRVAPQRFGRHERVGQLRAGDGVHLSATGNRLAAHHVLSELACRRGWRPGPNCALPEEVPPPARSRR